MSENAKYSVIGIIAIAALIGFKVLIIEETSLGHLFDRLGYRVWTGYLTKFDPNENIPVTVLDISGLKRDEQHAIPADKLREIVAALVENKAKAIAIDVDFSPRVNPNQEVFETFGRSDEDEDFFEFLHAQPIPVFLGVFNPGVEPETWLGLNENKDLAADITFYESTTSEIPGWFQCKNQPKLNSISRALSGKSGLVPQSPSWIKNFAVDYESPENWKTKVILDKKKQEVHCNISYTLVNYAKLDLIQQLSLQTFDKEAISNAKNPNGTSKFQNKLVLIGNGQKARATDQFNVEGHDPTIAGIYIHAMAVYTQAVEPVYRLKTIYSVILDGIFGLAIVLWLYAIRAQKFSSQLVEPISIIVAIVAVFILGFVLVDRYRVLWSDFFLVILALLLHSHVQEIIGSFLSKLGGLLKRSDKSSADQTVT